MITKGREPMLKLVVNNPPRVAEPKTAAPLDGFAARLSAFLDLLACLEIEVREAQLELSACRRKDFERALEYLESKFWPASEVQLRCAILCLRILREGNAGGPRRA